METKYLPINNAIYNDIVDYCKHSNITDIEGVINKCLKQGFDIKKYGFLNQKPEAVELTPVPTPEVIIKEVFIEKPIIVEKEVIIENNCEEFINNMSQEHSIKIKAMSETLNKLRIEIQKKEDEIANLKNVTNKQATFHPSTNLNKII